MDEGVQVEKCYFQVDGTTKSAKFQIKGNGSLYVAFFHRDANCERFDAPMERFDAPIPVADNKAKSESDDDPGFELREGEVVITYRKTSGGGLHQVKVDKAEKKSSPLYC